MRRALVALSLVGVIALAGCSSSGGSKTASSSTPTVTASSPGTIVAVASGTPDLSTLVSAVTAAGLGTTLSGTGPYTVFAPTNEAFAALPSAVVKELLLPCNKEALTKILEYHVLPEKVTASEITPGDVKTVEGQTVKLSTTNGVMVNDAMVTTADVPASNGVVHIINKVLLPSDVDVAALKSSC